MENAVVFLMSKQGLLAIVTAICTFVSLGFFMKGLKNKHQPYIWAWVIRAAICAAAFVAQLAQGAQFSLALSFSQLVCCGIIIWFILRSSPGRKQLGVADKLGLVIAGTGVVIWTISGDPIFSLAGVILADSIATAIGINASAKKRSRESLGFWVCALCASMAAFLAAGNASLAIILMPLFSLVNALVNIFAVLYFGRTAKAKELQFASAVEN